MFVCIQGFVISGATGPKAALVNGTYLPVTETHNGMPMYRQLENADRLLRVDSRGKWCVSPTDQVRGNENVGSLFSLEYNVNSPDDVQWWEVWLGNDDGGEGIWMEQASVRVTRHKPPSEIKATKAETPSKKHEKNTASTTRIVKRKSPISQFVEPPKKRKIIASRPRTISSSSARPLQCIPEEEIKLVQPVSMHCNA